MTFESDSRIGKTPPADFSPFKYDAVNASDRLTCFAELRRDVAVYDIVPGQPFRDMRPRSVPEPDSQRPDFIPFLVLCGVLGIICIGFWLFPTIQKMIQRQDCISIGREDCG